jgi:hypothetical protein
MKEPRAAIIPQTQSPAPAVEMTSGAVAFYQPRPARFIRLERLGDWRLKLYGIATPGRAPRAALVEATLARAAAALPQPAFAAGRMGIGFAIAHDAATASIALIYWWQAANELHQRVYVGPIDDPRAMTKLPDPAAGCVWELGIIDFERRAWIEDVLANPAGPDLERYLSRELNADI